MVSKTPQSTDFTRDVFGRYLCNGLDEALASTNTALRGDAKPFDVIIIGGGTFGPVLAHQLFDRDTERQHRILLLEGGPFVLPEHVQNLPILGLGMPSATSIADLRNSGLDSAARAEVWGLPWHSGTKFPGLAYCLGGRSLYWGGWSPQLLEQEMPLAKWPDEIVDYLMDEGFKNAGRQIGVNVTNDFIQGPLHDALVERLLQGLNTGNIAEAVPLSELPLQIDPPAEFDAAARERLKLEAPLGVQANTQPGFFPFNKFSAMPLLTQAVRTAQRESGNDDFKKRLMVVPYCHTTRLVNDGERVTAIRTNLGDVPVSPGAIVVLALGTIESTRLALLSFEGLPNSGLIGKNLMAHLRSNLTIRIPRAALNIPPEIKNLQTSALFVKGRHRFADGSDGFFHLQITASGLGSAGTNSEAELFKKVPDIDLFDTQKQASDTHVVVTVRGIGEMAPDNPDSFVRLDTELDEFGERRAFTSIAPNERDLQLWDAMDKAARDVAKVLAGGQLYEVLQNQRDGLGTTHHETGTLRMGSDPATSVTDTDGCFHGLTNTYALGPALLPTIGSPNPMLSGVALVQRLAQKLIPQTAVERGASSLFDGRTSTGWQFTGAGGFAVVGDALELIGGDDLGLLWYEEPLPQNYVLRLEWRLSKINDNSGVFVRFPDPLSQNYQNPAYVPVHFGFEVQIDQLARPDGSDAHRTGAIYGQPADYVRRPARPPGWWNEFEIRVENQTYEVLLNGKAVTRFNNRDNSRGLSRPSHVGLQAYPGSRVSFRNIRVLAGAVRSATAVVA